MASMRAFREPYLVADPADETEFASAEARQLRYSLYWAFYENTAYRHIHRWAKKYKTDFGLYRYIRNIYNPAYRLGEFWKIFLMGGALDMAAGDGKDKPSALPIVTGNEALRGAIGKVWRWSNWQLQKDILTLYGPVLGDVALKVVDDAERHKVYLEVVHPITLAALDLDAFGNVKGYTIRETREDPRQNRAGQTVVYSEVADRPDEQNVRYRTYLDGKPYKWNGQSEEWEAPYGFVPMVAIRHIDVGFTWGWSELHAARPKIQEVDDLASKQHDQIRKLIDAPWLFVGVDKPKKEPKTQGADATRDQPSPGREEIPALYGSMGADAKPLVAPLDIAATSEEIQAVLEELERDYPELQMDIWTVSGDVSGRALRTARQRAEAKVRQRRGNYDDALVRAQQMAVAIGGMREYAPEFAPFNLDSYAAGGLDHAIGERPVFAVDPLDDTEIDAAFWGAAKAATESGMPLMAYLKDAGWSEERIQAILDDPEFQNKIEAMKLSAQASQQAIEMANRVAGGSSQPRREQQEVTGEPQPTA